MPEPNLPSPGGKLVDGRLGYEDCRRTVEQLVADDVAFEPLARAIDETELLALDQRAALWLLAWLLIGPDANRARAGLGLNHALVTEKSPSGHAKQEHSRPR